MGPPALSLTTNRKTTVMYWYWLLGKLGYCNPHGSSYHRTPIKEKTALEKRKKTPDTVQENPRSRMPFQPTKSLRKASHARLMPGEKQRMKRSMQ